jgi:porphobilinogen synthase
MASTVSFSPGNVLVRPKVAHRTASFPLSANLRSFVLVRASSDQDGSVKTSGRTLEECEAAAVSGNFPAPPPLVKPAAPKGTPKINPLVSNALGFT